MEIELKYAIQDKATADAIWDNEVFSEVEEAGSREEIKLEAKYFDTEDRALAANEIAYRVRREGEHYVACMKWKGHSEDGLHVREEINVHVDSGDPDPEVFRESTIGNDVLEILQGKELKCLIATDMIRRQFRIDTGKGIFEISVDTGFVVTDFGETPVAEVEIELYSGETEELVEIGRILQEKYNLEPENVSKYAKGIEMIKGHK